MAPQFSSTTYFNWGNAYFMQQQYADAVARYDEVLAKVPADIPALTNKALALVLQGKLDAAEACYRAAQRAGPLPNNTLEPLLELKTAFAGLAESGLTVEVVGTGDALGATARHPDYRGSGGRGRAIQGHPRQFRQHGRPAGRWTGFRRRARGACPYPGRLTRVRVV